MVVNYFYYLWFATLFLFQDRAVAVHAGWERRVGMPHASLASSRRGGDRSLNELK